MESEKLSTTRQFGECLEKLIHTPAVEYMYLSKKVAAKTLQSENHL
jgi:hypothetical protein